MVLGDGAFGRCLGHEVGTLMNGISVCKRDARDVPVPSAM